MTASTNAPLIMTIFGFYIFIGVVMGLIGSEQAAIEQPEPPTINEPLTPTGFFGVLSDIQYFFVGIYWSITELPGWANTLLFLPLGLTVLYIMLSWLRGSS